MNILRFSTLQLVLGIALGVAACSNEPTGRVHGRVVNEFGAPVTGAQVSVDGVSNWSTASDGAGEFAVDGVAAGYRSLVVEKGDSAGVFSRQSLRIFVSEETNLSAVLLPTPPTLVVEKVDTVNEKNSFELRWSRYRQAGFREYKLYRGKTSGLDETTGELVHVSTDP